MKLYLTLEDDDGNKVERVIQRHEDQIDGYWELDDILNSMYESLTKSI